MEIQHYSRPIPLHPKEEKDSSLAHVAAKPAAPSIDIMLESICFPNTPRFLDSAEELLNKQQAEITRKKLRQDTKKITQLTGLFKQTAIEFQEFQRTHALFIQNISSWQNLPEIAAYLKEVPAFIDFYQKVDDILQSKEKAVKKLEVLTALYASPQMAKTLKFIEKHTPSLKKYFKNNQFIATLQLQLFAHYSFLNLLNIYTAGKITYNYQVDLSQISPFFLKSSVAVYHHSLSAAALRLSTYLQQLPDEIIPYKEARATLIAHYGNRVVNELALDFPIEPILSIAKFREMLIVITLRLKKEDLEELYHTIKGSGSYDLFACQHNLSLENIQDLQNTNNFQELNYEQLDSLVSAFRSYTFNKLEPNAGNIGFITDAELKNTQPIDGRLIPKTHVTSLAPITRAALNFLTIQEIARNYIQKDQESEYYSIKVMYASREYLAREVAPNLDFDRIEGTIFRSITIQNILCYSYVAATLSDKKMQAHIIHPLVNNPKGTLTTLLFGGFQFCNVADDNSIAFMEGLKAGIKNFKQLKDDIWSWFKKNLPNSDHIEVDVVGYKLGAHDTMMFIKQFVNKYYSQISPWYDLLNEQDAIGLETLPKEPTNLTNIRLVQIWALAPHAGFLRNCKKYNYERSLLQQLPEEKRPIVAHNYLHYLNSTDSNPQKYAGLYGWRDPNQPNDWYNQNPSKIWSYKDKDQNELSIRDTSLILAAPTGIARPTIIFDYLPCDRLYLSSWRCVLNNPDYPTWFQEITPENINAYLGQNSLVTTLANAAFSLIKYNVLDTFTLHKILSNIVARPRLSPYSFISTNTVQG